MHSTKTSELLSHAAVQEALTAQVRRTGGGYKLIEFVDMGKTPWSTGTNTSSISPNAESSTANSKRLPPIISNI